MKFAFISYADHTVTLNEKWTSKAHCIESWALALDADHLSGNSGNTRTWKTLNQYDVILINQNTTMYNLTCEIKKNSPRPFLVAVAEGSVCDIARFSPPELNMMIRAARSCDLYGILIDWAAPSYSQLTNKPIRWIGLPFYTEFFAPYRRAPRKKSALHPLIALQHSPGNGRNGLASLLIASRIPAAKILVPGATPRSQRLIDLLDIKNVDHFPYLSWTNYMTKYTHAYLAVHLDTLYTYGRFPLDMAALGIPTIGSDRNHTNRILWPQLTVDPIRGIHAAHKLATRLINDKDFYLSQINSAREALSQFSPDNAKNRLLTTINQLRQ